MTEKDAEKQEHKLEEADSESPNNLDDPTAATWAFYIKHGGKYDETVVQGWGDDMDSTLIFAGLFSAVVTTFVTQSYTSLSPDPADVTLAVMMHMSQQLVGIANGTVIAAVTPDPFVVTYSAYLVNIFWFLSLAYSLATALAATLVKGWVRSYIYRIESNPAPHRKARIRSYLHKGLHTFGMPLIVEMVPTLLHISVFWFLAGLFIFLLPINKAIAYAIALGALVIVATTYSIATILSIWYSNCPYLTPLSMTWRYLWKRFNKYGHWQLAGLLKSAYGPSDERTERDSKSLCWTLSLITEDSEFLSFLKALPGLSRSEDGHGWKVLENIANDADTNLCGRITSLLTTCNNVAAPQEHVIACYQSMALVARIRPPLLLWKERMDLLETLAKKSRSDSAISPYARSITLIMVYDSLELIKDSDHDSHDSHNTTAISQDLDFLALSAGLSLQRYVQWAPGAYLSRLAYYSDYMADLWLLVIEVVLRAQSRDNLEKPLESLPLREIAITSQLLIRIETIDLMLKDPLGVPKELMDFFSENGISDTRDHQNQVTMREAQAAIVHLIGKATRYDAELVSIPKVLATELQKVIRSLDDATCLREAIALLETHLGLKQGRTPAWVKESLKILRKKLPGVRRVDRFRDTTNLEPLLIDKIAPALEAMTPKRRGTKTEDEVREEKKEIEEDKENVFFLERLRQREQNFARSSVFDVEPTHTLSTLAARKLLGRRNHQNSEDNGYATEDHSGSNRARDEASNSELVSRLSTVIRDEFRKSLAGGFATEGRKRIRIDHRARADASTGSIIHDEDMEGSENFESCPSSPIIEEAIEREPITPRGSRHSIHWQTALGATRAEA